MESKEGRNEYEREFKRFDEQPFAAFAHEICSEPKILYGNQMFRYLIGDSSGGGVIPPLDELILGRESLWMGLPIETAKGFSNFSPAREGKAIPFIRADGTTIKLVIECREVVQTETNQVVFCKVIRAGLIPFAYEHLQKVRLVGDPAYRALKYCIEHPRISAFLTSLVIGMLEKQHIREIILELLKD